MENQKKKLANNALWGNTRKYSKNDWTIAMSHLFLVKNLKLFPNTVANPIMIKPWILPIIPEIDFSTIYKIATRIIGIYPIIVRNSEVSPGRLTFNIHSCST